MMRRALSALLLVFLAATSASAQLAVRGKKIYTMAGPVVEDGVIIIREGKVAAIGRAADLAIPAGFKVLEAAVVTPGLIDARSVVGLAGYFNHEHDQDQLERSSPMQPELRAVDSYNTREALIEWVRGYGVTTLHTGHAPGELISGQTMIVKTTGNTVEDAVMVPTAGISLTLGPGSLRGGGQSPGTRGKQMSMLRARLLEAKSYLESLEPREEKPGKAGEEKKNTPPVNLGLAALASVLRKEVPLLITAHRAQDIATALRLKKEFDLRIILDGGAEAYLLTEELKKAGVPVIIHPSMARFNGALQNASFETAARLKKAGLKVAMQSGYESYVPKTRVVLFEAAVAAANGLGFEGALELITTSAAEILGISDRVGSLAVGKDGDLALFDGDPFEYTTHCVGTIIEGRLVSEISR
ncbi:MAG: amidohydrolase family protein [Planctomycetota bacterium]|jgi:imidazolonepropionase-like amidohydrolase|nr:amidohydrolase family protein [Planctomycetota bacterium]